MLKTMNERYGGNAPICSELIKEKYRKTNLEKYGVEHLSNLKETREKLSKARLNFSKEKKQEILKKYKNTNLENHGYENIFQSPEYQEKIKIIFTEKYGFDHPMKIKKFNKKVFDFAKINGLKKVNKNLKDIVNEQISEDEYLNKNKKDRIWNFTCKRCGALFTDFLHYNGFPKCPICFPSKFTTAEMEIYYLIKDNYNFEIFRNIRKIIKPLELDIYLPREKIAIEYNGLIYHSIDGDDRFKTPGKTYDYHFNKTKMCYQKGIQLFHIYEDEWKFDKDGHKKENWKRKILDEIKGLKLFEGEIDFCFYEKYTEDIKQWLKINSLEDYDKIGEYSFEVLEFDGKIEGMLVINNKLKWIKFENLSKFSNEKELLLKQYKEYYEKEYQIKINLDYDNLNFYGMNGYKNKIKEIIFENTIDNNIKFYEINSKYIKRLKKENEKSKTLSKSGIIYI